MPGCAPKCPLPARIMSAHVHGYRCYSCQSAKAQFQSHRLPFFFHYLLTRVLVFRFSSIQSGCDRSGWWPPSLRLPSGRRWIWQLDKRRHQTTIIYSSLVLTAMGGFPYHLDLERCGSLSFNPLSEPVYEILICRCVWHANLTYIQTCIMRVGVLPPASQWFDWGNQAYRIVSWVRGGSVPSNLLEPLFTEPLLSTLQQTCEGAYIIIYSSLGSG